MASITIRRLEDEVKTRLRVRAAANGRSMAEETRIILPEAVRRRSGLESLASLICSCFGLFGGVRLKWP